MQQIDQLIESYKTLTLYCDNLFNSCLQKYHSVILCKPGCSRCCELQSVCDLEAFIIELYIRENPGVTANTDPQAGYCTFLHENRCLIYPVRPVICRTHGLIIFSKENAENRRSCCDNFLSCEIKIIERSLVADMDVIGGNLMRLNLAFYILLGEKDRGIERVPLHEIGKRA